MNGDGYPDLAIGSPIEMLGLEPFMWSMGLDSLPALSPKPMFACPHPKWCQSCASLSMGDIDNDGLLTLSSVRLFKTPTSLLWVQFTPSMAAQVVF